MAARPSDEARRRARADLHGAPKWRQDVHVAVIDIDVGKRDLQQCADAIMRLRGEWLFAAGAQGRHPFNDTDGKRRAFSARRNSDYAAFRKYMDLVFAYAGTYSLEHELKPAPLAHIEIGDVFIKGGFPGHAVLVADMVENPHDRREALPADAELHARAGDARLEEPGRSRRLAVVPGGVRRRRSSRPNGHSPRRRAAPLAVNGRASARRISENSADGDERRRARPAPSGPQFGSACVIICMSASPRPAEPDGEYDDADEYSERSAHCPYLPAIAARGAGHRYYACSRTPPQAGMRPRLPRSLEARRGRGGQLFSWQAASAALRAGREAPAGAQP